MYVPAHFRESDPERLKAFIRSHEFGTLITTTGGRPTASHLLLALREREEGLVLNGHMARANRQWEELDPSTEVLTIFQGPHTYISPRWYSMQSVPTWNYQSVHVYGHPRIISDRDELFDVLTSLVDRHEAHRGSAYRISDMPAQMLEQMLKAIVGFSITVTSIDASFKLSQNRSESDYANIISELRKRGDDASLAIADEMEGIERGGDE